YEFLYHFLTVDRLKQLLPDMAQFPIDRYEFANIKSLNFYIHGILQDGVSSSTRMDAQAKSLGEYLRAKLIQAPIEIIEKR
ncbi:MAG: exopolyphosphatase, partial [Gammaproteobacteria bacterium]|nr:exopolyphosphatase [Gammaproteobacteria bacterium]